MVYSVRTSRTYKGPLLNISHKKGHSLSDPAFGPIKRNIPLRDRIGRRIVPRYSDNFPLPWPSASRRLSRVSCSGSTSPLNVSLSWALSDRAVRVLFIVIFYGLEFYLHDCEGQKAHFCGRVRVAASTVTGRAVPDLQTALEGGVFSCPRHA